MKTEEDEAFDELAKRQGSWGGGYQAKRKMAADKLQEPAQEPVAWMVYTQDGKSVYVTDNPTDIQEGQRALPLYTTPPQPAQEPPSMKEELTKIMTDSYDQGIKDALETIVQLIKELRPAIRASEVMGKGKPTEEWFDILAGAIKEKNE